MAKLEELRVQWKNLGAEKAALRRADPKADTSSVDKKMEDCDCEMKKCKVENKSVAAIDMSIVAQGKDAVIDKRRQLCGKIEELKKELEPYSVALNYILGVEEAERKLKISKMTKEEKENLQKIIADSINTSTEMGKI